MNGSYLTFMNILWIEIALEKNKYDAAAALVLRNTVRDKIASASLGKFVGGGVSMNGSSCDLEVSCEDAIATQQFVRTLLNELCPTSTVSFTSRPAGNQPLQRTNAVAKRSWLQKLFGRGPGQ
jgi:hypothetical protein